MVFKIMLIYSGVQNSTRTLAFASKMLCRASKRTQYLGEKLGLEGRETYLEILHPWYYIQQKRFWNTMQMTYKVDINYWVIQRPR